MTIAGSSSRPGFTKEISVEFPITLEFSVTHNIFASANSADFSLYNLSQSNRSEIFYSYLNHPVPYPISLRAGYVQNQNGEFSKSSLPLIFQGYGIVAYTERNGSDLITRINAMDNGDVTNSIPPGYLDGTPSGSYIAVKDTPFKTMVRTIMGKLHNVTPCLPDEIITDAPIPNLKKDWPFVGTAWGALQDIVHACIPGGQLFIDNGICYMISQKGLLGANNLGVLSNTSGLLGIPKYMGELVTCSCVFEPALKIGTGISLDSELAPWTSGQYKIVGYTHHGVISGINSGSLTSDISLMSLKSTAVPTP